MHWFQNCNFWKSYLTSFRGCRGQMPIKVQISSKLNTTKILNENLQKLDEKQNSASATLKMTSWPQWPQKGLGEFFQKLHFSNQHIKLRKMSYVSALLSPLLKCNFLTTFYWPRRMQGRKVVILKSRQQSWDIGHLFELDALIWKKSNFRKKLPSPFWGH